MNPPLRVPTAWSSGQLYDTAGLVRTNGGNMYQLWNPDASNNSVNAPTGTDPLTPVTDAGTSLSWMYLGATNPTSSAIDIPTVTSWNSSPGGGLTNVYNALTDSNMTYVQMDGAAYVVNQGNAYYRPVATTFGVNKSGNIWSGSGGTYGVGSTRNRLTFVTDAPKFAVAWGYPQPIRLIVDNALVWHGIEKLGTSTGLCGATFDYSTVSGRKRRVVTVETSYGAALGGVYVDPASVIEKPDMLNYVRAVFVGDSYVAGANNFPMDPGQMWPVVAGNLLGWGDVVCSGVGGTGMVSAGSFVKYASRLNTDLLGDLSSMTATFTANSATVMGSSAVPDVIVFCGSVNDIGQATIGTEALALYNAVRANASFVNTVIVFVGVCQVPQNGAGTAATAEKAMFDALPTNDPLLFFIPVSDTTRIAAAWHTGTGNDGFGGTKHTNGNGTNDAHCSGDTTHFNRAGHNYMGYRFAQAFKTIVLRNLI
ncbi:MAG: hypothetical protein JSS66_06825 [Armatimonadetes bacterium]|nr:hypothetical protein [Armatimonadota bacterium]